MRLEKFKAVKMERIVETMKRKEFQNSCKL
jgi:hypothetical protein